MSQGTKTLDQRRATHAWERLVEFADRNAPKKPDPKDDGKLKRVPNEAATKFGREARKLPMRIMTSGLGQSLAFLLAKGKTPALLQAIADWVLYERDHRPRPPRVEDNALLLAIIGGDKNVRGDSEFAQLATAEALAYLRWLVRFVEAEGLTGPDDGGD